MIKLVPDTATSHDYNYKYNHIAIVSYLASSQCSGFPFPMKYKGFGVFDAVCLYFDCDYDLRYEFDFEKVDR